MAVQGGGTCLLQDVLRVVRHQFRGTGCSVLCNSPVVAHSIGCRAFYLIRFRGGAVYFVQPWLGKYFSYGFAAHFVLLAFMFVILWLHRDEVERVSLGFATRTQKAE
jgi:hypothetical protein